MVWKCNAFETSLCCYLLLSSFIYFLHATGMRVENASADVPLIPGPGRFASHLKGVRPTWM